MPTIITCKECGETLLEGADIGFNEETYSELFPCSYCGGETPHITVTVQETVKVRDSVRYKAKRPGIKKPILDGREGSDFFRKTQEWRQVSRKIDRSCSTHPEAWYEEKIIGANGEVVREVSEPFSQHRNRGSARKDKSDA